MDALCIHMLGYRNDHVGGPMPKFTDYHVWKALMALDPKKAVGRKKLSESLDIGEGSTRTIIKMLQEEEYIEIDRDGIRLSDKGMVSRDMVYMEVGFITLSNLTIGDFDCAVRIPHMAKKVMFGCEERDRAIKAGASGATTLVCSNGNLVFPGSDYPVDMNIDSKLRAAFTIKNDDVIIIGTASNKNIAERGAITAALYLIGGLRMGKDMRNLLGNKNANNELISLAFAVHDLVGGLPVCAKNSTDLGIRIENGAVIDNAYTGTILEEAIITGTTIRKVALSGPYKGLRVIVTPIEINSKIIAAIGVVDIRAMAGIDSIVSFDRGN